MRKTGSFSGPPELQQGSDTLPYIGNLGPQVLPEPEFELPTNTPDKTPSAKADVEPSVQAHTEEVNPPVHTYSGSKLTWSSSSIREVIYNKQIKDWMNYYPGFANWVRSCMMLFADNVKQIELACRIPDQYRNEIGETITITWDDCIPIRKTSVPVHEIKPGVMRVMA